MPARIGFLVHFYPGPSSTWPVPNRGPYISVYRAIAQRHSGDSDNRLDFSSPGQDERGEGEPGWLLITGFFVSLSRHEKRLRREEEPEGGGDLSVG